MAVNWEAIEQWRDALRSGKYKQARARMYDGTGYCCLGVFQRAVQGRHPKTFKGMGYLDRKGQSGLGVKCEDVPLWGVDAPYLNDSMKLSFDEIADLLDIALIEREGIE